MTLDEYMKAKRLTDSDVASQVNRDRSTVTRWRLGRTRPDFDALIALEKMTKGKVSARDFVEAAS
jgi:transcriptional regulator with XRE-family HTH domain